MVGPAFPASENMLTAAISRRVAAMLGTEPQAWRSVRGGHTQAGRWLVEDAHGYWPPPWSPELIQHTLEALARVAATAPPAGLPLLADSKDAPGVSRSYPTNRGLPPY